MLEPWIIEEIRRREQEQEERREQPVLDLPLEPFPHDPEASPVPEERGVFIIDT